LKYWNIEILKYWNIEIFNDKSFVILRQTILLIFKSLIKFLVFDYYLEIHETIIT
jgi:hypothetical protein